jgi:hypothetical protein
MNWRRAYAVFQIYVMVFLVATIGAGCWSFLVAVARDRYERSRTLSADTLSVLRTRSPDCWKTQSSALRSKKA